MSQTLSQRRTLKRAVDVLRATPRRVFCKPEMEPQHQATQIQDMPTEGIPAYVWAWIVIWGLVVTFFFAVRHLP